MWYIETYIQNIFYTDDKGEDKKQAKKLQKQTTKKEKKPLGHRKDAKVVFNHPWLAGSLKSHSGPVLGLDFSPNGKYLASCSEGRNSSKYITETW